MRDPVLAGILSLIIPGRRAALQRPHSGGNFVVDVYAGILGLALADASAGSATSSPRTARTPTRKNTRLDIIISHEKASKNTELVNPFCSFLYLFVASI